MKRSCLLFAAGVFVASGPGLAAQGGTSFSFGFGVFADYPSDFQGTGCSGRHGGFTARLGREVSRVATVDADVTWTGSVFATSCVADALSRPAPPDGTAYTHTELGPTIRGETFFASRLGVTVAPWPDHSVSPSVRVGGGRLWDKELWAWTYGAGARVGRGRHGLLLEAERWSFGYDVRVERWVYRATGPDDLQDVTIQTRRPGPWLLRASWVWRVGRG